MVVALLIWNAGWPTTARAAGESPRVVRVEPPGGEPSAWNGMGSRLESELRLAGFEVLRHVDTGTDAHSAGLGRTAAGTRSIAAISVAIESGRWIAHVWLTDRTTGEASVQTVEAPDASPEAARILALRVADLLYASSLELQMLRRDTPGSVEALPESADADRTPEGPKAVAEAAPAKPPAKPVIPEKRRAASKRPPVPEPTQPRAAVGIGAAVLGGPGGFRAGFAPVLMASYSPLPGGWGEAIVAAPALGSLADATGTAEIDQELALLRARIEFSGHDVLVPYVAAGFGGHRLGAQGHATAPNAAASGDAFSWILQAAGGLRIRFGRNVALVTDLGCAWLTPRPVLRFASGETARAPLPLLSAALAGELAW